MGNAVTDRYLNSETGVFFNKMGIEDATELREFEYSTAATKARELLEDKTLIRSTGFDFARQKEIHHHLFQDVYEWAGKERTTPLRKANEVRQVSVFTEPDEIAKHWSQVAERANAFAQSKGLSKEEKVAELAALFIEINKIHAFPEGNGRATQVFMQQLAQTQGINLDYTKVDKESWNLACSQSGNLHRRFEGHLIPIQSNSFGISQIFNAIATDAARPSLASAKLHYQEQASLLSEQEKHYLSEREKLATELILRLEPDRQERAWVSFYTDSAKQIENKSFSLPEQAQPPNFSDIEPDIDR